MYMKFIPKYSTAPGKLDTKRTSAVLTSPSLLVAGPVSTPSFVLPSLRVAAFSHLQPLPPVRATALNPQPRGQLTTSLFVALRVCLPLVFCPNLNGKHPGSSFRDPFFMLRPNKAPKGQPSTM